jgi:hypothetical protein
MTITSGSHMTMLFYESTLKHGSTHRLRRIKRSFLSNTVFAGQSYGACRTGTLLINSSSTRCTASSRDSPSITAMRCLVLRQHQRRAHLNLYQRLSMVSRWQLTQQCLRRRLNKSWRYNYSLLPQSRVEMMRMWPWTL